MPTVNSRGIAQPLADIAEQLRFVGHCTVGNEHDLFQAALGGNRR